MPNTLTRIGRGFNLCIARVNHYGHGIGFNISMMLICNFDASKQYEFKGVLIARLYRLSYLSYF